MTDLQAQQQHGTALEGAARLMSTLERFDWRFSLDKKRRLCVTIGDTPAHVTQSQLLSVLSAWAPECVQLLGAQRVH